jgi:hypothetical protein
MAIDKWIIVISGWYNTSPHWKTNNDSTYHHPTTTALPKYPQPIRARNEWRDKELLTTTLCCFGIGLQ